MLIYKIHQNDYKPATEMDTHQENWWKSYFQKIFHMKIYTTLFYFEQLKTYSLDRFIIFDQSNIDRQNTSKGSIYSIKKEVWIFLTEVYKSSDKMLLSKLFNTNLFNFDFFNYSYRFIWIQNKRISYFTTQRHFVSFRFSPVPFNLLQTN